ncbi:DUF4395 domain-containing protein [uncultured Nocardioides sp.]|uniref:DUF4395 domain-containing protein n=1 Tax=uncultured Nocardioides sp. TaxID=198441 RepID=UPI0025D25867|nr:DUF4395 domain-containing protein [uncultured Nocardioides sp.]
MTQQALSPAPAGGTATAAGIDPRGPRVSAALTALVLAAVLLLAPGPLATLLVGVQAVVFGLGAALGVQHAPYALLFRSVVRPRLAAPDHLEDPRPPRFASAVGLVLAVVALVSFLLGATTAGLVATGLALAAALLNAATGLCLGCELYLLGVRVSSRRATAHP